MSTLEHPDFEGLNMFGADLVMVDPPWKFETYSKKGEKKSAKAHYECMALDKIKALRIGELVGPHSVLLLWATTPMLPQAFEVMNAWGFTYKSKATWVKKTKKGKNRNTSGYVVLGCDEPLLIGTIGRPFFKPQKSVIEGLAREHSRKPDEAYAWAERLCPKAQTRYDLFSREDRPGWTAWGKEVGKFNREVA